MEDAWAGPVYTQLCAAMQVRAPTQSQAQPVLASRIALQRSGEQLSTNGEKEAAHLHHVVPGVHACFGSGLHIGGVALCVPLVEEHGLVMD